MKRLFCLFLMVFLLVVCLVGCHYDPPEGYTQAHHTYEDALAYAKTLDPNATVLEEYADLTDEWDCHYRQWPAVIMGIECHVASAARRVWNTGFMAGEFAQIYYVMDTDFDYLMMQQLISENQPQWTMKHDTISGRYHSNELVSVVIPTAVDQPLTDEELEIIWQAASQINDQYCIYPVHKEAWFSVSAPLEFTDSSTGEAYIKLNHSIVMNDFSAAGKVEFFEKYHARWALLESGLPIRE